MLILAFPWVAIAASPSPRPAPPGDPRGGPMATMTGDPVLVALSVVLLGVATAAVTALVIHIIPKHE